MGATISTPMEIDPTLKVQCGKINHKCYPTLGSSIDYLPSQEVGGLQFESQRRKPGVSCVGVGNPHPTREILKKKC